MWLGILHAIPPARCLSRTTSALRRRRGLQGDCSCKQAWSSSARFFGGRGVRMCVCLLVVVRTSTYRETPRYGDLFSNSGYNPANYHLPPLDDVQCVHTWHGYDFHLQSRHTWSALPLPLALILEPQQFWQRLLNFTLNCIHVHVSRVKSYLLREL